MSLCLPALHACRFNALPDAHSLTVTCCEGLKPRPACSTSNPPLAAQLKLPSSPPIWQPNARPPSCHCFHVANGINLALGNHNST